MKQRGLSGQLNWLIVKVTIYSFLTSFATYSLYPTVIGLFSGQLVPLDLDQGTASDWITLLVTTLLTIAVSVFFSARFARQMIVPLESLTHSAKRVAEGDLSARASEGAIEIGEINALVKDFNRMAETLETLSNDSRTWNAAIAHELRTPVTILRGRLQGLADGIFAPDHKLFVNLIHQADGLTRLIEDLRTLSLAQTGHLHIHYERVNIKSEIESLAELVKEDFKASHHSLVLKVNPAIIECDALRFRQVMLAFLENARRYSIPGVVMISCEQEAGFVAVHIDDEGPGIDPAFARSIWDAFVRTDDSRSRLSGGTGLGLAVVKAIVLAQGGKVSCEKNNLNGTRFSFWLPETKVSHPD
ncbi:ATP-binding protein [Pantoea sp. MHSD4]|uniref:ATP-binding protein n=1 Tax=Pantoea sp. MHSD4 TaxID=2898077 RepID=UPI000CF36661|nr:ATP-binding protein [Pantoea sp. MHSD4]MCD2358709.1 ATP-binding protein [Pantoea sp. MHSD4]PQL26609.1 two-component sensor histidine kinase [Pantoea ananatis]